MFLYIYRQVFNVQYPIPVPLIEDVYALRSLIAYLLYHVRCPRFGPQRADRCERFPYT